MKNNRNNTNTRQKQYRQRDIFHIDIGLLFKRIRDIYIYIIKYENTNRDITELTG